MNDQRYYALFENSCYELLYITIHKNTEDIKVIVFTSIIYLLLQFDNNILIICNIKDKEMFF